MQTQSSNWHKDFTQKNSFRFTICLIGLVLIVISIILSIRFGAMNIDNTKVADIILNHLGFEVEPYWKKTEDVVVWVMRLPRSILACVAGCGLAISGVAMQAAVKNPLADPYILGISAGASAGATLVIAADLLDITSEYSVSIGAFLGAASSMVLLFAMNRDAKDSVRLLLSGCVISILFSSITSVTMFLAKDQEKVSSVVFWLMGSIADANWNMLPITIIPIIFGLLVLMIRHRELDALLLGDETAHTLGVNTDKLRWQLVVLVSIIVGGIVAFCGMIGFVGFVIPHIIRSFVGASHKFVVPLSAITGSLFLLWCDVAARTVVIPEELPIGIITALSGAPFFMYVLQRRKLGRRD